MTEFEWAEFVLRQGVQFHDEDEVVVGLFREKLKSLRVYFQHRHDLKDTSLKQTDFATGAEWDDAVFRRLREALELIGLALHYDKRTWPWLRPEFGRPTFVYNADDVDIVWEFTFHDNSIGDRVRDIKDVIAMFLRVDATHLSTEYFMARQHLYELIGERFDPEYRIPVSFVLAPRDKLFDVDEWCQVIRDFAWAVRAPAFVEESCFSLASVELLGWQLRVNESVASLISELQLAQVPLSEVNLKLIDTPGLHSAKTMRALCGCDEGIPSLLNVVGIHDAMLLPFVRACSSLIEAQSPSRLVLYNSFGQDQRERAIKWGLLGCALWGVLIRPTSIRHLRVDDASLSLADVRRFVRLSRASSSSKRIRVVRTIRLAPDAVVWDWTKWYTLDELGVAEDDEFVVITENGDDGETMVVLVPGFGLCKIRCESIIDASTTPRASVQTNLSSLHLGINTLGDEVVFRQSYAEAFVAAFPVLEFLDMNHVTFGSMDVLQNAYDQHQWRVSVLSMTNSFVDPTSMTRFARRLQDPLAPVTQRLREFRFIFEDYHASANGGWPEIITADGAAAFRTVLECNSVLTFIELGLVQPVYDGFHTRFSAFDKSTTTEMAEWMRSKLAFLSVVRSANLSPKKHKGVNLRFPVKHRRRLVSRIWSFLPRPTNRVVLIFSTPRPE